MIPGDISSRLTYTYRQFYTAPGLLRRSQTIRFLLTIPPDSIRRDFNRVMWENQLCRVRPNLQSGGIGAKSCKKLRRVWGLIHDTMIFAHDSFRFHQTWFISRSFQIRATALALILTLVFRRCKIKKNFYLHACHTNSSFSIAIWCDTDWTMKEHCNRDFMLIVVCFVRQWIFSRY